MSKLIKDQFTNVNISRQQKYQLRMRSKGMCIMCGKNILFTSTLCFEDAKANNIRVKKSAKVKRRYKPILAYKPHNKKDSDNGTH